MRIKRTIIIPAILALSVAGSILAGTAGSASAATGHQQPGTYYHTSGKITPKTYYHT